MQTIPDTSSMSLGFEEKRVSWDVIRKQAGGKGLFPNLRDYDAVREAFTWGSVRAELAMPGGLNIAYHALDRDVVEGRGNKLALRWLGKNGEKRDTTYREVLELSCRFANLLRGLGEKRRQSRIAQGHLKVKATSRSEAASWRARRLRWTIGETTAAE